MDIRLDSDILTSDGETAGKVDSVIVNGDTHEVMGVIAREGRFFSQDRIIERQFINSVDSEGRLHLSEPMVKVDDFPEFVEAKFTLPDPDANAYPDEIATTYPVGRIYFAPTPTLGRGDRATAVDPSFPASTDPMQPASYDSPPFEVKSNLPEADVVISEGTKVVDRGGKHVGDVAEVLYSNQNQVTGFIVKSGIIFKHDVQVPVGSVDEITHDHVRLTETADEAERVGRMEH